MRLPQPSDVARRDKVGPIGRYRGHDFANDFVRFHAITFFLPVSAC